MSTARRVHVGIAELVDGELCCGAILAGAATLSGRASAGCNGGAGRQSRDRGLLAPVARLSGAQKSATRWSSAHARGLLAPDGANTRRCRATPRANVASARDARAARSRAHPGRGSWLSAGAQSARARCGPRRRARDGTRPPGSAGARARAVRASRSCGRGRGQEHRCGHV
jgi:hypothetical protein